MIGWHETNWDGVGGTICLALLGFLAIITSPSSLPSSAHVNAPLLLCTFTRERRTCGLKDCMFWMGWEDASAEEEEEEEEADVVMLP